jgi:hypothetical protein
MAGKRLFSLLPRFSVKRAGQQPVASSPVSLRAGQQLSCLLPCTVSQCREQASGSSVSFLVSQCTVEGRPAALLPPALYLSEEGRPVALLPPALYLSEEGRPAALLPPALYLSEEGRPAALLSPHYFLNYNLIHYSVPSPPPLGTLPLYIFLCPAVFFRCLLITALRTVLGLDFTFSYILANCPENFQASFYLFFAPSFTS